MANREDFYEYMDAEQRAAEINRRKWVAEFNEYLKTNGIWRRGIRIPDDVVKKVSKHLADGRKQDSV